jgi:hypothetical protein
VVCCWISHTAFVRVLSGLGGSSRIARLALRWPWSVPSSARPVALMSSLTVLVSSPEIEKPAVPIATVCERFFAPLALVATGQWNFRKLLR